LEFIWDKLLKFLQSSSKEVQTRAAAVIANFAYEGLKFYLLKNQEIAFFLQEI
jgi:hypothetical protein